MGRDYEEDDIISFLIGLCLGCLAGGVLAILLAPKKGSELREDIQGFMEAFPNKVHEEIKNPEGKTRGFFDQTRINLEGQVKKVGKAIQANKMAAAKRREEQASGFEYN